MKKLASYLVLPIVTGVIVGIIVSHYQEGIKPNNAFKVLKTMGDELFPEEEIADLRIILFKKDGSTEYPDYDLRVESESWGGGGIYRFKLIVASYEYTLVDIRQIRPFAGHLLEYRDSRTGCQIYLHYPRSPYFDDEGLGLLFLAAKDLPGKSCALDSPRYDN